jgi:NTE family protein
MSLLGKALAVFRRAAGARGAWLPDPIAGAAPAQQAPPAASAPARPIEARSEAASARTLRTRAGDTRAQAPAGPDEARAAPPPGVLRETPAVDMAPARLRTTTERALVRAAEAPATSLASARAKRLATWPPEKLSLALQGGGSFGAFAWGVLDRLLEEPGIEFDAVSGSSAGAINAVLLASGLTDGGREAARARLSRFWRQASQAAALAPQDSLLGAGRPRINSIRSTSIHYATR